MPKPRVEAPSPRIPQQGQGPVPGGAPQRPGASESHWTRAPLDLQVGHRSPMLLKAWEGAGAGDGPSLRQQSGDGFWETPSGPPPPLLPRLTLLPQTSRLGPLTSQSYLGSGVF